VLLAGSGLLLKSFQRLLEVDPGFRAENTLVARLQPPYPRYENAGMVRSFYDRVIERTSAIPGVRAVGLVQRAPFTRGNPQDNVVAEGHEPKPGEPVVVSNVRLITPGYFAALGTPVLEGRTFTASDGPDAPRVAIVDETFARRFWPNGSALGKRISHQGDTSATRWVTIVGVVPNVRHTSLGEELNLQVYQPFAQQTPWTMYLIVRAAMNPRALVSAIRGQVASVDAEIPLYEVRTMEEAVSRSLSTRRLTNVLLTAFATAAFVLAAIGIYGVISIGVAGRTREFGVRLALGHVANHGTYHRGEMAMALTALGAAAGVVGALAAARTLRSLLYDLAPADPWTYAGTVAVLALAAAAAALVPAARAARASPLEAIRHVD